MMILHDAGIDQSGFGAAEGASQQLPVLREAAGFGMMSLQDAGRDQGGWSVNILLFGTQTIIRKK